MNSRTILALALTGAFAAPVALAQTCYPNIRRSAPDARYVVNAANGTVLDQRTGLMWKRCVEGYSGVDCAAGQRLRLNWGAALRQAAASTFAGYKDWRIPNSKELQSLVEVACNGPALNATVFPNDPADWVWVSSPDVTFAIMGRVVDFDNGNANYGLGRVDDSTVRLVRGGQ